MYYLTHLFGQVKLYRLSIFFQPESHFSAISAGTIQGQSVSLLKQSAQRYFKGIIKWYLKGVPYLS